jgi:hypothetical protein
MFTTGTEMENNTHHFEGDTLNPSGLFLAGAGSAAVGPAGKEAARIIRERVLPSLGLEPELSAREEAIIRAAFTCGAVHAFQRSVGICN